MMTIQNTVSLEMPTSSDETEIATTSLNSGVKQNAVSLEIPVPSDKIEALTTVLNSGGNPSVKGDFFDFSNLTTVHFARWIIAPKTEKFEARLIYAANIDGGIQQHLEDLVMEFPTELNAIFSCCAGYTPQAKTDNTVLLAYLKKHLIKTPGFYVGAPNRSVEQIHLETKLHKAVKDFVQKNGAKWNSKKEAYTAIKKYIANDPKWDWARKSYHLPKRNYVKTFLLAALLVLSLPILLVFVVLIHFFYELRAQPFGKTQNQIPVAHLNAVKSQEDIIYQNQLSQVFETKGGLRKLGLKFFLWATSYAARNWFVEGQLMGTPTIHFARWVLINGGDRFVFFSNFDGSFDEYLGDFVDNNGWGLNAIYGASKHYPRTYFMFGGGSYKILEFMGWGRITQVTTPIWYSAYPWYGLQQIVDRSKLRVELCNSNNLNDNQIATMLRRI